MRKIFAILTVVAAIASFGCSSDNGSSAKSPWAAPSAPTQQAAPAEKAEPAEETKPKVVAAPDKEAAGESSSDGKFVLGEHLRAAVEAEGANMLAEAAATEPLPPPFEGKFLVMSIDQSLSLVEFKSVEQFKKGERVTFYKSMKPGVLKIIAEPKKETYMPPVKTETSRAVDYWIYTAEEVRGVIGAPLLEVEDELVCVPYIDPNVPSKKGKEAVVRCPHCGQTIANSGILGDATAAVDDDDEDEDEDEDLDDDEYEDDDE